MNPTPFSFPRRLRAQPARAQAVPDDGARAEGGTHHGAGGEAHGEAERGLHRQQVVDAARLGHQDRRHGEEEAGAGGLLQGSAKTIPSSRRSNNQDVCRTLYFLC